MQRHLERLRRLTDVGDSVSRVEALLREIRQSEKEAKDELSKAEQLIQGGQHLIDKRHYAVDSIKPKCKWVVVVVLVVVPSTVYIVDLCVPLFRVVVVVLVVLVAVVIICYCCWMLLYSIKSSMLTALQPLPRRELQLLCDEYSCLWQRQNARLKKSHQLHEKLETANGWCARGVEFLASQQIERFQVNRKCVCVCHTMCVGGCVFVCVCWCFCM